MVTRCSILCTLDPAFDPAPPPFTCPKHAHVVPDATVPKFVYMSVSLPVTSHKLAGYAANLLIVNRRSAFPRMSALRCHIARSLHQKTQLRVPVPT